MPFTYYAHAKIFYCLDIVPEPVQDCPLAPCAYADVSSMNFEPVPIFAQATPLTASTCSGSN